MCWQRWAGLWLAVFVAGCQDRTGAERNVPESGAVSPASTQAGTAPASAAPVEQPERGQVVVRWPGRRQQGWLLIEGCEDGRKEAYAEGRLVGPSRLEVDTRNVSQLRLDLGELAGRAPGRLILHIDGQGFEITGARGLSIALRRSGTGAWQLER
ncbi:MAG TPA: hypothetical protein VMZ31_11340 [Phycisphaerae bacterium]|nr:hypothetical protein [Phycisphaerae bacterium]